MKKLKGIAIFLVIIVILLPKILYAQTKDEGKKLLYQDVTINTDGSIMVKEAIWLNGTYNGTYRKIKYTNNSPYNFTGIYSNFSGDTDIYDATGVSDIKVFDISQSNFRTFEDINNVEYEFSKVNKASNGDYGFYTIDSYYYNPEVKIYCPSEKQKVIYLEYKIKDAIVVHNDIAELYWSFLENTYPEIIEDYQLVVHLPQEDNNVMVWSHGPATGRCSIVDNKTLSLVDKNVEQYKKETLRIMFDKSLVPQATKLSNVNGKDNIIKYENAVANPETSAEEKKRVSIENQLVREFSYLEKYPNIYYYNSVEELIQKITWDNTLRQNYQEKLDSFKDIVNQNWKESLESEYKNITKSNNLTQAKVNNFISLIDKGFDAQTKYEYYTKAEKLQKQLDKIKIENKQKILQKVAIMYGVLGIICILTLVKILRERRKYNKKYYRDFPSEDNAYIIDYLMNKKITSQAFVGTILGLIAKGKISIEKDSKGKYNFVFNSKEIRHTETEEVVIKILFNIVGDNDICSVNDLINYVKTTKNTYSISKRLAEFREDILLEVKYKEYFKEDNLLIKTLKISPIIILMISFVLGFLIANNGIIGILSYYILIFALSAIYYKILSLDKRRTEKGALEYSKWLAHKRFLEDFGSFEQKDLPDVILWDKYLVTATVLGCSDKIINQIKIHTDLFKDNQDFSNFTDYDYDYLYRSMNEVNSNFSSYIKHAKKDISPSSSKSYDSDSYSYDSSSSGYGGGSSDGGSGGGGGGWGRF